MQLNMLYMLHKDMLDMLPVHPGVYTYSVGQRERNFP